MAKLMKFKAKVMRNEYITPTVFEIDLEPEIDFSFLAGQFVQIVLPDPRNPEKKLKRSYSICSAPEKNLLTFCIKLVSDGLGTPQLSKLSVGSELNLIGPFGKFIYLETERTPFFISTGTGIAPFYSMLDSMKRRQALPKKAISLLGVRTPDEILYDDYMSAYPNITWVPAVSKPLEAYSGFNGRVSNYLESLKDFNFTEYDYYLCGNGAMINQVKDFLKDKGVDKLQIHQEIYFK